MEKFSVDVEIHHQNPDLYLYRNLLTPEECDHMIKLADPHLRRSVTFAGKNDSRRTSSSVFGNKFYNDPVMRKIMKRCATLVGYPANHVELPQVVRYFPGEQFMNHADNYPTTAGSYSKSGQRDFTFFIYLNEPEEGQTGGETIFSKKKIPIKPERGMAATWRNIKIPTGEDENYKNVVHSGEPPNNWTKWGMNVWIRHKPYTG